MPRHTPPKFRLTANCGKRRKRKKNKNIASASAPASVRVPIVPAGGKNAVKDSRRTPAALARRRQRYPDRVAAWQAEEPDQSDRAAAAADSVSKARSASRVQSPQTAKASWLPPLPPPPGPPPPVFGLPLGPLPPPGPRPPRAPPSSELPFCSPLEACSCCLAGQQLLCHTLHAGTFLLVVISAIVYSYAFCVSAEVVRKEARELHRGRSFYRRRRRLDRSRSRSRKRKP